MLSEVLDRQAVRYLIAGGTNTLATYVLYLAVLAVAPYPLAYSLAYGAGIVLSFVLNSRFVFRVPLCWRRLLQYPVVYVVQYALGYAVLYAAVDLVGMEPWLGPMVVVAVTVPVSFVLTRWILRGGRRRTEEGSGALRRPLPSSDENRGVR